MEDKKKNHLSLIDIKWMLTLAGAGCIIVLFYLLIGKLGVLFSLIKKLFTAISPIVVGCVIAFILNPIVNRLRVWGRNVLRKISPNGKEKLQAKVADAFAVFVAIVFFIACIFGLLWILIPSLYDSIMSLYGNFDKYAGNIETYALKLARDNANIINYINTYMDDIENAAKNLFTEKLIPNMDGIVKTISSGIIGGVKFVLNFVIGIIAAIYILLSKDTFSAQGKKIIYAAFKRETGNRVLYALEYVDSVFGGFIIGKVIDSIIIAFICFGFCKIVHMPYAVLISVIIGVTNIIPFFGPIIGAIPSTFLVLVESPKMCIIFIIFILILQQVDGNIIGPIILSDSTGLSSFWVLTAILIGGNLFGFAGMVLGVPTFACIYALLTILLRDNLNSRGLNNDTDYFVALRGFDENDEPIRGPKRKFETASSRRKREKQQEKLYHSKKVFEKVTHIDITPNDGAPAGEEPKNKSEEGNTEE